MAQTMAAPVFTFSGKRVLFVDNAKTKYSGLIARLEKDGIVCEMLADPATFMGRLRDERFDLCFLNLMIGGGGPSKLIGSARSISRSPDLKIIILTKQIHQLNFRNAIQAGANDFVIDPFEEESVYHRIHYHLVPKRIIDIDEIAENTGEISNSDFNLLLEANEILSHATKENEQQAFLAVLQKTAAALQSNRTSLVIVDSSSNSGLVLATSDDPTFFDFPVSLTKYPEILHVMNTGQFVCVEDVSRSALTQGITAEVKDIPIGSLMVFPVLFRSEVVGVLNVRRPEATDLPPRSTLRALEALANTLAAYSSIRALLRKIYKDFVSAPKAP